MKKIINIAMLLVLLVSASSCLKSGLDDLPTYDEAKITNIYFEYRWYDDAAKQLRVQTLTLAKTIDEENNTVTCKITVPGTNAVFTEQIRNEVSLSNIVCYIDMSETFECCSDFRGGARFLGKGFPLSYYCRQW